MECLPDERRPSFPSLCLLRQHGKYLFMILLQPVSNFFFRFASPSAESYGFVSILQHSSFPPVWQALKIFFYDFPLHNSACSVCINFHTGKFLSDLSNTTGNRTRHSRSLLAFHNIFNRTNILDSAFFLLFYFLRRSLSQTFSWLMKNNLNE